MSTVQLQHDPELKHTSVPAGELKCSGRLDAIDIVRGAVMVLMALDHSRGLFSDIRYDLVDLDKTSTVVFFTRWVTHFCAPVFVFLAGTSAYLYGTRGKTRGQLVRFLISRGVWLVFLEFTLIHLAWSFRLDDLHFFAQVIWAIGCSLILLASLVFLPARVVGLIGLVVIVGHQAVIGLLPFDQKIIAHQIVGPQMPEFWLVALLRPGRLMLADNVSAFVVYPVLPWFGMMALGYGLGSIWTLPRQRRRLIFVGLGVGSILLFASLRALNGYGDPSPWMLQRNNWFSFLSFINCSKYPPSLLYVLMTLGPAALALAFFDRPAGPLGRMLVVFGRVPFFYYLLHLFLIHGLAVVLALDRYGRADFLFRAPFSLEPSNAPADYGYQLAIVYLLWFSVVAILYPPCRWFSGVKSRYRYGWLSYF
jgi:uncharacterized membrane protein